MTRTLKLQIVTPEGTVYSEDVGMVGLRAVEGQIGILPNHLRLMTQMLPGEMMVRKDGRDQFLAVARDSWKLPASEWPLRQTWPLPSKASMKPGLKKRVIGPKPGSARGYLTKKLLPSMLLWLAH